MSYSSIDLFMGIGGASLSLQNQGFDVVAAVDIDPRACEWYEKNIGLKPICADLYNLSGRGILDHYGLEKGSISCLVGCPPCQGFSSLRRTRFPNLKDDKNNMVKVFAEKVGEIKPKAVILENVSGIVGKHGFSYFEQYLNILDNIGYSSNWGVFNAADYGVPQHRRRFIAISILGLKEKPLLPKKTHVKPKQVKANLETWKTVEDTIKGLPPLEPGEECTTIANHIARSHTPRILEMISLIPPEGSRRDLPLDYWLECHKRLEDGKGAENIYGRMRWKKPSPTMTSRCTTPSSGRFLHPEQNRAITPREAARFQTFPDHIEFPRQFNRAERYIGNAVPVKFLEVFLDRVKDYL